LCHDLKPINRPALLHINTEYWRCCTFSCFSYTGDAAILQQYQAELRKKLATALAKTHDPKTGLRFIGWDDRTGAGFSDSQCAECEHDFRFLVLRAVNETAVMMASVNSTMAAGLAAEAMSLTATLRKPTADGAPWYTELLLASASDAINAGVATEAEQQQMFAQTFSDSLQICQLSPFNTYWTLQALGRMGKLDQALFVLRHCYGGMIMNGATTFWYASVCVACVSDQVYVLHACPIQICLCLCFQGDVRARS
jgi:hypothetical protein